ACGRRRAEAAAAARANPAMAMNASDHWANRRQLDVIISVKARLICRGQGVLAVRAPFRHALDNPVRIGGERPEHPGTALSLFCRAALGAAGFRPCDGGIDELSGVLGGPPSFSSSSAT